jgi:hypothetical protein
MDEVIDNRILEENYNGRWEILLMSMMLHA